MTVLPPILYTHFTPPHQPPVYQPPGTYETRNGTERNQLGRALVKIIL